MVSIQSITTFEDFYRDMYNVYRMETVRFRSLDGIEYRIVFLSFDIRECEEIITKLRKENLIEDFVQIDDKDLLKKLKNQTFYQPLEMVNYFVYPISEGNTALVRDDKGFQRKMKSLGYDKLPHVTYKRNGNYKIRFPERFIRALHSKK